MSGQPRFRTSDMVYDHAAGLLARLYVPDTPPLGAVVVVHGGAWSAATGILVPGDIIATGTPLGAAAGMAPPDGFRSATSSKASEPSAIPSSTEAGFRVAGVRRPDPGGFGTAARNGNSLTNPE